MIMSWKGGCLIAHWFLCCFWFLMSFFWFFLVFCRSTPKPYNWYWKSAFYWVYWGDLNAPNGWLSNSLFWWWFCCCKNELVIAQLKLLHTEVKLFNKELKLVTKSVWLSTEENRQNKAYFSAVIAFATQKEVQKALRTKIMIAEISVCTAEYTDNKPYDQCQKCQGFEHTYQKCVN